ncbi:hypothetical protein WKR88_13450 [Trinickia caryophylli]|uniref:Uncharacterized protein n=1 Tax=Trinickia caryophylli TaxID=28094 RepID=A0A1X7ELS6_TRICW|nr:hypothetical protein [Trinickia caryophylli]PMS10308.1 hypothetical protein C0Z17_21050 [Trinickia caryophylli]TRX18777.1 hypothetical protein FNF07_11470 [Trinickia caryophylli]WQE10426.1 hypothetical protein U0034_11450 [Trinickia caryophylli]SMF36132.1 hypothetical protein SAMN06295900_10626 [Trinickia caryophylli]GLU32773.1 hypothetical protein Busp01_26150 [Trinickia caryophylli]
MQVASAHAPLISQQEFAGPQAAEQSARARDQPGAGSRTAALTQDAAVSISAEGSAAVARERATVERDRPSAATPGTHAVAAGVAQGGVSMDLGGSSGSATSGSASGQSDAGGADGDTSDDAASTASAQSDGQTQVHVPTDPSAVKSFTYGTLGLERPDQPQEAGNEYYTAGRWLAAGVTLWGIIALLA